MRIPPSGWSAVPSPNNHRSPIAFADETDADFDQPTSRRTNAASTQTEVATAGATGPSPKVRSARREAKLPPPASALDLQRRHRHRAVHRRHRHRGRRWAAANPESADPGRARTAARASHRGPTYLPLPKAARGRQPRARRGDLPDRVALGPLWVSRPTPIATTSPSRNSTTQEPEPVSSADATPAPPRTPRRLPTATAQSRPRPWRCRPDGPLAAPMLNRSKRPDPIGGRPTVPRLRRRGPGPSR